MSEAKMLEELEAVVEALGIELRLAAGEFAGGLCRVYGRPVLLLNRKLPTSRRVQVLCRGLSGLDLSGIYLLPAVRSRLEREAESCSS